MSSTILENDFRALQSLELFKNWLAKHAFLKYTGDDNIDELLMCFLRIKKFNMQKAYECFEYNIQFIKSHPDMVLNLCPADYDFTDKPDSPFIFLKNLDAEGRRICIYKMKNYDDYDSLKTFRRFFLTPLFLTFDSNAILNGIVLIVDFSDVHMGKVKSLPVSIINDSLKLSKNGLIRLKKLNIIGLPSFFKPIFEIAKSFMSAKILQRINFINDLKELSSYMDVSVLPKDYGGSSAELLDYSTFELGLGFVDQLNKFDVNLTKIQNDEYVGSFRKLEID